MRLIDIALKDLRQITRDRKTFLFLLIMPVGFTLLFGFAFGGNNATDARLPVGLVDEDDTQMSQHLNEILSGSEIVRLEAEETAVARLQQQVLAEELAAAIIIPAGFEAAMLAHDNVPVQVVAAGQTGFTVEGEVQTAVARLLSALQTAELSLETAVAHDLLPTAADRQAYFDEAFVAALAAWRSPPIRIKATESSALLDEANAQSGNYSTFAHTSPAMMAQFAIAGLIGAATILVVEKKTRSVQRLLTTNLSRGQILLGHYLAMFVMVFLQLSVLILFGQLILDLPYLGQPLATLLITVVTSLFCASLGLLIGAISKSEEQVIVFALVPMFLLSALGGAWVPLEFTPESFQQIAYLTPVAWILDGYKDILVRGQGLEAVGTAVLILFAYAAVLFVTAVWRFRFD